MRGAKDVLLFCVVAVTDTQTVWENIFANDTLDKGLFSKIYK